MKLLLLFFVFQNLGFWTAYTLRVRQRGPNEMCVIIYQSASLRVLEHLNLHQQCCDELTDPICSLHLKVRPHRKRTATAGRRSNCIMLDCTIPVKQKAG